MIAPARRAAFDVVRRVFEDGAYADRAFGLGRRGLDPRDRALAQRIAYGTVQRDAHDRPRHRRARPAGRCASSTRRCWRRCASPATSSAWSEAPGARGRRRRGRARARRPGLERATGFTNAVARRLAEGFRGARRVAARGAARRVLPRLDLRDLGARLGRGRGARADARPERAGRARRPLGRAGRRADRRPRRLPRRARRPTALAGGRDLAEPRLAARRARASARRTASASSTRAPRRAARRRCCSGEVTAVELHPGRARELEENVRRLGATNVRVVNADVRELDERGFDRALVDAPCSGLGVLARRPDLRWRAKPLPGLQLELLRAAAERTRPGGTVVYSVCTLNADENEAVVDALGLEPEPLGEEWPQFAHPKRPEFLLTTPHRHGTSGFFIARLRV